MYPPKFAGLFNTFAQSTEPAIPLIDIGHVPTALVPWSEAAPIELYDTVVVVPE